jgi:NAD(P)-dependent dehydrogenase (short-subunit alcohol dehydrogenase family)
MRFQNKVVWISGAGSGIGEAAVRRFAAEGAHVVAVDVDGVNLERVAAAMPGVTAHVLDVGDAAAVRQSFRDVMTHYGRLDVVFNNAGITGTLERLHEMPEENWESVARVNGAGMFYVLKHAIAAMLQGDGGAIINTSSISGLVASGLTRAAACDYAAHNIRVNAIAPGQVLTPLVERLIREAPDPDAEYKHRSHRHVKPGFIEPADIAAAVAFLASDDARWITGVVLPIDGGYTAR